MHFFRCLHPVGLQPPPEACKRYSWSFGRNDVAITSLWSHALPTTYFSINQLIVSVLCHDDVITKWLHFVKYNPSVLFIDTFPLLICQKALKLIVRIYLINSTDGNVMSSDVLPCRKYEEIYPPKLNDFVYITDSTYTKGEVIQMEHLILKVLSFKMAAPTMNQFLRLFMSIQPVTANIENLALVSQTNHSNQPLGLCPPPFEDALFHLSQSHFDLFCLQYVAELSLMEIEPFLHYTSSIVAAAAFCLALYTVNKSLWVGLTGSLFWILKVNSYELSTFKKHLFLYFSLIPYLCLLPTPWRT